MNRILTASVFLATFALALAIAAPPTEVAAETKPASKTQVKVIKKSDSKKTKSSNKLSKKVRAKSYSYIAQPGDAYSQMARKAVQTYAAKKKMKVSEAGIVFAETNLAQKAGSPEISVGQVISIAKADVANWTKKASKLSKTEQAAWQDYVPYVDFNTGNIKRAE